MTRRPRLHAALTGVTESADPPSAATGPEVHYYAPRGVSAALQRITEHPTHADWTAHLIATQEPPMPTMPPDLPDHANPDKSRFGNVRDGGNLPRTWWKREARSDKVVWMLTGAGLAFGAASIVVQVVFWLWP